MDEKKYQIFISSTYKDLELARDKIIETILKLYHFPVGMEMFSADDDEQWEVIQDTIDISDYYILIIGHRYGSVTDEGISYTEKEYDYAKSKNIPILAFIRNRDVATKPHERDEDPAMAKKVDAFIQKASSSKMCDFWDNDDDLSTKVAIALPKIFRKNPRTGWVRGNLAISAEVSEEMALLSKENRTVRDENEKLQQLLSTRKPIVSSTLNGKSTLEVEFEEKENLSFALNGNDLPFWTLEYPESIDINEIPEHLKPYLRENDYLKVREYNNSLPTNEEIDEHNLYRELYFRMNGTALEIEIEIKNEGSTKANEIHIDLDFPDFVTVMSKSDIKGFDHPKSPIPSNPLKEAEEEYEKEQKRKLTPFAMSNFTDHIRDFSHFGLSSPSRSFHDTIAALDINKEVTSDFDRDNRKLTIRVKSILHTRKISIQKYFIIPIRPGEGDISISTVCEEYSEPKLSNIPLIIKQNKANQALNIDSGNSPAAS